MKIALIGMVSTHMMRWVNAFAERGHDVTFITCKVATSSQYTYHKNVKIVMLRFAAPLGYYLNAGQLKRIIKKSKFDVVNVHYASGYGTLARRAKLKGALLNVWGSDVYDFPYESAFKMRLIKKNLSYFKRLASTSKCMAMQVKKLVDRECSITPFGVDTQVFKPLNIKKSGKIIFGTVKALAPKYGIADTINAFVMLVRKLESEGKKELADNLYYDIYGKVYDDATYDDKLRQLIKQCCMEGRIELRGFVPNEQLPEILNGFTLFNCNSTCDSESFGVAAVEAMACGIAVQVSDAEGFAEVVEDKVTGLLSPKGDVEAICQNMYELLLNNDMREAMGKAGVERVKKLYDWQSNVDEMEKIYTQIVNSGV